MGVTQPCSGGPQIAVEAACPLGPPPGFCTPCPAGWGHPLWPDTEAGGPGLLQLSQVRLPTSQTCSLGCWGESMSGTQAVVVSTGGSRSEVKVQWTIIAPRGNGIKEKAEGLAQTLGASWTEVPGKPWPQQQCGHSDQVWTERAPAEARGAVPELTRDCYTGKCM